MSIRYPNPWFGEVEKINTDLREIELMLSDECRAGKPFKTELARAKRARETSSSLLDEAASTCPNHAALSADAKEAVWQALAREGILLDKQQTKRIEAALSTYTQPDSGLAEKPFTYAYRYKDYADRSVIRYNDGREVNGSKPVEAIPLYTALQSQGDTELLREAWLKLRPIVMSVVQSCAGGLQLIRDEISTMDALSRLEEKG